jgi:hypothetical protein
MQSWRSPLTAVVALWGLCFGMAAFSGCERKERVVDIQTPGGDLEVNRNVDTGEVEVNVTDKD